MRRPLPAGEPREYVTESSLGQPSRASLTAELEGTLGYRVYTREGRPLGRLAWMRHGFTDGYVEALMIRPLGFSGLFSGRENPIPSELVETVSHGQRRVVVNA